MTCTATSLSEAGPRAQKLVPRLPGPALVDVGSPPEAPSFTAVKPVPVVSVQSGTGTTPPVGEPAPASAPGFLTRLLPAAGLVAADAEPDCIMRPVARMTPTATMDRVNRRTAFIFGSLVVAFSD